MNIPFILSIFLTLVALLLPGLLKSDGFAPWMNGVIAGGTVALFAGLVVWADGQFTGNLLADWALFTGAYSALLLGPLHDLDKTLQSNFNLPFLPSQKGKETSVQTTVPERTSEDVS